MFLTQIKCVEGSNTKLYILEMPCMYPSSSTIVLRGITQSFIYKKYLVYDPAQVDCVG